MQDDLFGYPLYDGKPPSVKGSETSKEAAKRMPMIRINALHMQIKQFLESRPKGATDEEMQAGIPMAANTQRPRRVELTQLKQVVDSGFWRPTKTKRKAVLWTLKEYRDKALEPLLPVPASPALVSEEERLPGQTNAYYDEENRLIHDTCAVEGCTKKPGHGVGVSTLHGRLGMWYCAEHKPSFP